jgi:hypothetical protein
MTNKAQDEQKHLYIHISNWFPHVQEPILTGLFWNCQSIELWNSFKGHYILSM